MSLDALFLVCNASVVPFWLLLVLAPSGRLTRALVHAPVLPIILGLVYAAGFLTMGPPPAGASFSTLAGVTKLFTLPQGVLIGWVHYLVFDLFIGAWETRDALRLGISRWLLLPCLMFTFMLGPIGLLLYVCVRYATRRRLSFAE